MVSLAGCGGDGKIEIFMLEHGFTMAQQVTTLLNEHPFPI